MLHYIYSRSLIGVLVAMPLLLAVWGALSARVAERQWRPGNLVLLLVSAAVILYATLFSRAEGGGLILTPFAALAAARVQPELYREMLMNVFLFFPLGLTLSNALPRRWNYRRRIGVTVLAGCLLSAGIECAQYRFALGLAETDDVLCNTLGALLGAASLLVAHAIESHKERGRHTNMTLTATETQFLHIAKVAVSGGEIPAENVDWPAVFALAGQQKLLPLVFEAARGGKRRAVRVRQAAGRRAGAEPDRARGRVCRPVPKAPRGGTAPHRGQGPALQPFVSAGGSPHQR